MKKILAIAAIILLPVSALAQTPVRVIFKDAKPKPQKPVPVGSLEKLLHADNIGKNYRKLKFLNNAIAVNGRNRDYIIEDCKVRLWVFRNEGRVNPQYDGIIEAIEVEVSQKCNFDITKSFPSLAPLRAANEIQIKDITRKETEFYTKCLIECGEPKFQAVEFRYGLQQLDGYLAIDFIIDPAQNPQTSLVANKFAADILKAGAKVSDDINCDITRNQSALKAFANEKPTRIRFGMEDMDRESLPSCKIEKQ